MKTGDEMGMGSVRAMLAGLNAVQDALAGRPFRGGRDGYAPCPIDGSDCPDGRACADMYEQAREWANTEAHGRRSRTVQPLVGGSGLEVNHV